MLRTIVMAAAVAAIVGCGGSNRGPIASGALDDISPYRDHGTFRQVLKQCAAAENAAASCTLQTLPTIGMETATPTAGDIMERVLVSHPWMGARFEQLLAVVPADMLQLFGAVTAVVIDADIRPSYYLNLTGAIYLDPQNLWLTAAERTVISTDPDYRLAFAEPMAYRAYWQYVKDNRPVNDYAWSADGSRTLSDIEPRMASLLFHELAHANDLFPPALAAGVDRNLSFLRAASSVFNDLPSTWLFNLNGLESDEMRRVANILYRGFEPNSSDREVTAAMVGSYFEPDAASDDYAYYSQYEDLAMLFEETMMKLHYDMDRDLAYVTPPRTENPRCNDYVIGWGVRNRIAAEQVSTRAQWVVEQLLPARDYGDFFAGLGEPTQLPEGAGWCAYLSEGQAQSKSFSRFGREYNDRPAVTEEDMLRPYDLLQ